MDFMLARKVFIDFGHVVWCGNKRRAELAKNAGISLDGYDATEVRLVPSEKLAISRIRYSWIRRMRAYRVCGFVGSAACLAGRCDRLRDCRQSRLCRGVARV